MTFYTIQKEVRSMQKQPSYKNLFKNIPTVKKGAALFKMASVKKVVKSKGRPRNGCDGIREHLQTDFVTLNVIMTLRGGGSSPMTL